MTTTDPRGESVHRSHEFETGDQVCWHNEIAEVDFPGYRGRDIVRIKLPPIPGHSSPDYRWVDRSELREHSGGDVR